MANQTLVHQSGNRLFVTSLDISNRFGRQHKNVLQAIDSLDCSDDFRRLNFKPSSYNNSQNKPQPMYEITRDGFVFLCMGFTGPQAALWKERYIQAFNEMENALRQRDVAPPLNVALPGIKLNRNVERQLFEHFVAGNSITDAARAVGISRTAASLMLHGKYQFPAGAGLPECSDELIAAVAARHLTIEQERIAANQERIAQRYLQNAHNAKLALALGAVGEHLQKTPTMALTTLKAGK